MNKLFLRIIFIFLICFVGINNVNGNNVDSEYIGGGTGTSRPIYDTDINSEFNWNELRPYGLKVTVYTNDGKERGSRFFINDESSVKLLNDEAKYVQSNGSVLDVYTRYNGGSRLTLSTSYGEWKKGYSTIFEYIEFDNLVDDLGDTIKSNSVDLLDILKNVGSTPEEIIKKFGLNSFGLTNDELRNAVLVVEPATMAYNRSQKRLYFGTYWDFNNYPPTVKILSPVIKAIGNSLMIKKGAINDNTVPLIKKFLNNFSNFASEAQQKDSYGVGIILLNEVAQFPNEKICQTQITTASCNSNYKIIEPTDRDCVINHPKYQYKAVGDCGIIYCSENISTNLTGLDNFYNTFTQIIRSGSYFKMKNVKVDVTRTCYFESFSNSPSCNNWHNNIEEENAGTIGLNLVSNYTLVKDSNASYFEVKCDSYSNGRCTKATSKQHVEYVLEPNTNRYISIKEMAGTLDFSGIDVYDLGGEHLTTPISLSTGNHNYEINYQNAGILTDSIGRLMNKIVKLDNPYLNLIYSYNQPLTLDDLKYSCSYTAKSDRDVCPSNQCCDGDEIVPCPPPCVCDSVTGCDENCVPNPPECDCGGDCCDSKCNVIDCPNPDDEPGGFPNVVYRPINLEEGFPGEDGTGRDPGSNWYGYVYDQEGNTINKPNGAPYTKEEYYINFNRGYNDYDIYHSEPLYVIKLDYDTLKYIREYNEFTNHDYNDIKLKCDNGQECRSFFLRGIVDQTDPKFNRNLITDGSCKIFENCF